MDQELQPSDGQRIMFAMARKASQDSVCKYLHGSAAQLRKEIVKGCNVAAVPETKLFRLRTPKYWSLHSEIALLLKIPEDQRKGINIYNWREDRHGLIADSKPCDTCQLVLKQYGVNAVFYTTRDGTNYRRIKL